MNRNKLTRDDFLKMLISSTPYESRKSGLSEEAAKQVLASALKDSIEFLGIELRTKGNSWYILAYDPDIDAQEFQVLSFNRLKPYLLEMADIVGIASYIKGNVILINAMDFIMNGKRRLPHDYKIKR